MSWISAHQIEFRFFFQCVFIACIFMSDNLIVYNRDMNNKQKHIYFTVWFRKINIQYKTTIGNNLDRNAYRDNIKIHGRTPL